jgi:hypothetical protein
MLKELINRETETDQGERRAIALIKVRSALMRVRWKDIPVRRAASSTEMWSGLAPSIRACGTKCPSFAEAFAHECGSLDSAHGAGTWP